MLVRKSICCKTFQGGSWGGVTIYIYIYIYIYIDIDIDSPYSTKPTRWRTKHGAIEVESRFA